MISAMIEEAADRFGVEAMTAANEDALDAAWTRYCQPMVEEYGDEAYNRFMPIDEAARARIQGSEALRRAGE